MPDVVRQDDVVARDVERLARPVELVSKLRLKELRARPSGPVQDHHRIDDPTLRVPARLAQSAVVHPQFGQGLTVREGEVAQDDIALAHGP